ncbi:nucleotidyltransferase family protein [Candidatus Hydrogenedentota bacterium]
MSVAIEIPQEEIASFCKCNHIRKLSFFGSVVRKDLDPESDVDVLVEFELGARVGLITLAGMEIKLSQLLDRKAEIHAPEG